MLDARDAELLLRSVDAAARAGRATAPNPRVGAVVAKGDAVVAEGWHARAGEPHAEAVALRAAGAAARGATLYTSLEPCAHHGRTPPCTEAILAAGIARVVVALEDPDPRVAGTGVARLRAAGLRVEVADGAPARAAEQLNEDYLVHRRDGRAYAALKVAATLDGRIADRAGASRWITGEAARARGRALRERYGAILVGAGTVLADDPILLPPAEGPGATGPRTPEPPFLRCVIDPRLRIGPGAQLLARETRGHAPVVVFTSEAAPADARRALEDAGAEVVPLEAPAGRIPPADVLRDLARRGVLGVLVEGGGATHGLFLEAGLADKIYWFTAPRILGDPESRPAVAGGPRPLGRIIEWRIDGVETLGDDVLLTLYPCPPGRPAAAAGPAR